MTLLAAAPSWTGTIPTWLLLALALGAAWRLSRGGGGTAISELSKANEVLTNALEKQKQISADQAKQIAALELKTDVVLAVTPMIAAHEHNAQERHEATVRVLEAISGKLTKDSP